MTIDIRKATLAALVAFVALGLATPAGAALPGGSEPPSSPCVDCDGDEAVSADGCLIICVGWMSAIAPDESPAPGLIRIIFDANGPAPPVAKATPPDPSPPER